MHGNSIASVIFIDNDNIIYHVIDSTHVWAKVGSNNENVWDPITNVL